MTDAQKAWEANISATLEREHPDVYVTLCDACHADLAFAYLDTGSKYRLIPYVSPEPETCETCGRDGANRYLGYWFENG